MIAKELGIDETLKIEDLCLNEKIKSEYLKGLTEQGKKSGLFSFE